MGYAGGKKKHPTYHSLGDHTETFEVDYDPARISYGQLLDRFWEEHDPTVQAYSVQYRAAVFCRDDEQCREAEASRMRVEDSLGRPVVTAILPFTGFTPAEAYHQKFYLTQVPALHDEARAHYPDPGAFVASTAVARLNGYVGGNGSLEQLRGELDLLGLSPEGRRALWDLVSRRQTR